MPWMNPGDSGSGSGSGTGGGSGSGSGSGTGSGSGSGSGSGTGGDNGSGSGNGLSDNQDAGSKKVEPEQETNGSSRPQRSTPEGKRVEDYCIKEQEKRKQFRRNCCELSATRMICGDCKESMQQCNKCMRKLLDAADDKFIASGWCRR